MTGLVVGFRAAVETNSGVVHGPFGVEAARVAVVERARSLAGDAPVAVPDLDPVLEQAGAVAALEAAHVSMLRPGGPRWRDELAAARVGLTGSIAAVAGTGSVAVSCGPGAPRSVSLLPDAHLCLVRAADLFPTLADALDHVLALGLPPALVWVSGPSRSADIAKQITLGVHGPRTFEVVLVDG